MGDLRTREVQGESKEATLNFLARSAKVAERAICFTDRNFFLFFLFFIHLF